MNSANFRLTIFDPASSVPSFLESYVLAQGRRSGSLSLANGSCKRSLMAILQPGFEV